MKRRKPYCKYVQTKKCRFTENYRKTIKNYEVEMDMNQKSILQIQEALTECRNNMDSMQLKEKQLEKLYRKDFQDVSPVVQEQSFKLYK